MAKPGRKRFDVKGHLVEIERLAGLGLTDKEICLRIGAAHSTLYKYKTLYSELSEAIKRGRAKCHEDVSNVLYHSAVNLKNPISAMFILKARFGYRDSGPVQSAEVEEVGTGSITYIEIDGRKK